MNVLAHVSSSLRRKHRGIDPQGIKTDLVRIYPLTVIPAVVGGYPSLIEFIWIFTSVTYEGLALHHFLSTQSLSHYSTNRQPMNEANFHMFSIRILGLFHETPIKPRE